MITAIINYILKQPTTPPKPDVKPVAWSYELAHAVDPKTNEGMEWQFYITPYPPKVPKELVRNIHPLYRLEQRMEHQDAVDS